MRHLPGMRAALGGDGRNSCMVRLARSRTTRRWAYFRGCIWISQPVVAVRRDAPRRCGVAREASSVSDGPESGLFTAGGTTPVSIWATAAIGLAVGARGCMRSLGCRRLWYSAY